MDEWTVVLKADGALSFEIVEADYGLYEDEVLNFKNAKAASDLLAALGEAAERAGSVTKEQAYDIVERILRSWGQANVASFKAQYVVGFFRGRRAIVSVEVASGKDE